MDRTRDESIRGTAQMEIKSERGQTGTVWTCSEEREGIVRPGGRPKRRFKDVVKET